MAMAMLVQQTASSQQPTAAVVARTLLSNQPVSTPSSIQAPSFWFICSYRPKGKAPISSSLPLACYRVHQPATAAAHLRCLTLGPPANNSSRTGSNANHLHFSTFLTTQYLHPTGPFFFPFLSNEQWIFTRL